MERLSEVRSFVERVIVEVSSSLIIKFILYAGSLLLGIRFEYIGLALGVVLLVAGYVLLLLWRWKHKQDRIQPDGGDEQWSLLMPFLVAALIVVVAVFLAIYFGRSGDCVKVDITDYNLPDEKQLFELKYKTQGDKVWTLNLVKELAGGEKWKKVALVMEEDPDLIYRGQVSNENQIKYCEKLIPEMISMGFNDEFGWSAYIKAFKEIKNLNAIVKKLEAMLKCLKIDLEAPQEATKKTFDHMSCDGTTLHLTEAIAPYWEEVALKFRINTNRISSDSNVEEQCSRTVLKKLVAQGYDGALGWDGILRALKEVDDIKKLVSTLETALMCVVMD